MIENTPNENYMEAFPIPEGAILLDIDVPLSQRELAVAALKEVFKERNLDLPFGPQLDLNNPERILALNRFALQIVTTGMNADEISIPLKNWSKHGQAPQLLLAAQVDQENNVVYFTGVLTGPELEKLVSNRLREQKQLIISVDQFQGGVDRLLRFVRLLNPNSIPRNALLKESEPYSFSIKPIQATIVAVLGALYLGPKMATQVAQLYRVNEAASLFASNWNKNNDTLLAFNAIEASGSTRSDEAIDPLKVCLLTPVVQRIEGQPLPIATTSFDRPMIYTSDLLNEVVIRKAGKIVWRKRATLDNRIRGPISWPLDSIQPGEKYELAFRSGNFLAGEWSTIQLIADSKVDLKSFDLIVESLGRNKEKWINAINQEMQTDKQLGYALLLSDKSPNIKEFHDARTDLFSKKGCN